MVMSEPSPNALTGRTSSWEPQRKVRAGWSSAAGTETEVYACVTAVWSWPTLQIPAWVALTASHSGGSASPWPQLAPIPLLKGAGH